MLDIHFDLLVVAGAVVGDEDDVTKLVVAEGEYWMKLVLILISN